MKSIAHANRGQGLETLIEYANQQYAAKGIAQIQKVPTPWKVIRKGKQIVSAFPEKKSTVDFIGDYKGRSVCFEAKSTENKTLFPLANFEEHQIEFMRKWTGIKFAVIEFKHTRQIFFLEAARLLNAWDNHKVGGPASIPYEWCAFWLDEIEQGDGIVLDYLKHVEVS